MALDNQLGRAPLLGAPSCRIGLDLDGDPASHAMEPAAESIVDPERPGLASQGEKHSLNGIIGVVAVIQHAPANCQNQRAVSLDQCLKRQLIAV
jgi:hypothetical protein